MYIRILLLSLLASLLLASQAVAQACCSGGVPVAGTLGLSAGQAGSWQFLLSYDYNSIRDLVAGTEVLEDRTRSRATQSVLLETNYSFNSRLALTALLSGVRQERRILSPTGNVDLITTQGIGDGVVLLKYRLTSTAPGANTQLLLGAGPKIPLGRTNFTNDLGLALPAEMQPGSGAWDLMLWSWFKQDQVIWPNLSFSAGATFRLTGTNPDYFETQSYRFGNQFILNSAFNYRQTVGILPIDVQAGLKYRHTAPDRVDGNVFPSSGGQWIYAVPTVQVNLTPDWSVRISSELPLYRNLDGTQLSTSFRLNGGIQYTLAGK